MSSEWEPLKVPSSGPTMDDVDEMDAVEKGMFGVPNSNASKDSTVTGFADLREGFITKVLGIVSVQLAVSFVWLLTVSTHEWLAEAVINNMWLFYLAMIGAFACIIALACSSSLRFQHPTNYVLLWTFTACEAYTLGPVGIVYTTASVMQTMALTLIITAGLAFYGFTTKRNIGAWAGAMYTALCVLLFAGIVLMFFPGSVASLLYSIAGAILFSAYLVLDTWRLSHNMEPDEFILGAINLYLDVLNLFLFLLRIFGKER